MSEQTYMYAYVTLPRHDQSEWYSRKCYRDGRRVVLANYDLMGSKSFSFKEKLRKSVKGINESAERLVLDVRQGTTKRRFAIRVLRTKLGFYSCFLTSIRRFTSCFGS
ncbi:hypothetical protein EUTSA_v10001781mg [Eutrema salsugineum]|uniref:Uncharacterized protein n=1 Tax=Eutrema salsugineum TaxID=72664 RepID=V4LGP9_EUTSA|nr:uncharacterized protein LOC18015855 [Eutrema salsugineum]ESQ38958.1 hypothetical protein EUTSA_v10001781mg [Eutrema salsugineum]